MRYRPQQRYDVILDYTARNQHLMSLGDTVITYIESVIATGEQQFDIIAARTAEVATLIFA